MIKKLVNFAILIIFSIFFTNCSYFSKDKDKNAENTEQKPVIKKKKRDHNLKKRAEEYDGGIIFGKKGVFSGRGSSAQFAADNILWRASLQSLDFTPFVTANYSGGILITDWYSGKNSKEAIKIQVAFNSNEVKASSFEITSFKKICTNANLNCKIKKLNNNFNSKIKRQILETARDLKIKQEELENKK